MDTQNTASFATPSKLVEDFRKAAEESRLREWVYPKLSLQFEISFLRGSLEEKREIVGVMTDTILNDIGQLKNDGDSIAKDRLIRIRDWSQTLRTVLHEERADVGEKAVLAKLSDSLLKNASDILAPGKADKNETSIHQTARSLLSLGKSMLIPEIPQPS